MTTRSGLVVLIGDDDDPHIHSVAAGLEARGVDHRTIGVDANFGLVAALVGGDRDAPSLMLNGSTIPLDGVVGILDRGRSSMPLVTDERWQYVFRERKAFLEALPGLAPRARWLNHPAAAVRASNKILQLLAARRAGFRVPLTHVTNDVDVVRELVADTGGDVVFKALTWLATIDGRVLFTNPVGPSVPDEFAEALRPAPVIFQGRVRKQYELRVTRVGDRSFAARIESQERADTALDWRRNQEDVRYAEYELPPTVEDRLRAVMAELGIAFGAFDLARDADGEYVFFEVNPAGNWLWLEDQLNLPISQAVADWLCGPVPPGAT